MATVARRHGSESGSSLPSQRHFRLGTFRRASKEGVFRSEEVDGRRVFRGQFEPGQAVEIVGGLRRHFRTAPARIASYVSGTLATSKAEAMEKMPALSPASRVWFSR